MQVDAYGCLSRKRARSVKQGRTRLIVAQSLITAILLGVIALTLLSPDHQNTLFAVGVPEAPGPVMLSPPSYDPGGGTADDGRDADADGADADGSATGEAGGVAGTADAVAPTPGDTTPAAPSPPGTGDEPDDAPGPPTDQYGDTLARLSDTVD